MKPSGLLLMAATLYFGMGCGVTALAAETPPTIIVSPPDKILLHETTLSVVLKVNTTQVDQIQLWTSMGRTTFDLNSSKAYYCQSISLRLGENRIDVRSYKDNALVSEQVRHLYVTSPIYQEFKYPPTEYQRHFFHTDTNEAKCQSCHDMSVNEVKGVAFIDVTKSNCYHCHHNITNAKYAHAPAVNWLCTSCHNGEVGSDNKKFQGRSKYLVPEPVNTLCFRCHKKNFKLWQSYRYRHEPLDSGRCNKCHNSHASPYKMFVRKPVNSICMGCHKDKQIRAKRHGSKCEGASEGKRCIACHTPHASSREFFLKEKKSKEHNGTRMRLPQKETLHE